MSEAGKIQKLRWVLYSEEPPCGELIGAFRLKRDALSFAFEYLTFTGHQLVKIKDLADENIELFTPADLAEEEALDHASK